MTGEFPRGIEVLLAKAKVDEEFRCVFFANPLAAASGIGLELTGSERAVLSTVPAGSLAAMVDRTTVRDEHRGAFRGRAAAAMLAALAGVSLVAGDHIFACGARARPSSPVDR